MKTDQLLYFLEVARHEHVGRAARALSISPSAVSHSLAALEEELGCALFERQGKRIFLSPHGKRFNERAGRLMDDLKRLKDEMSSREIAWEEDLRLAGTHGLAESRLAPAWAALMGEQPKMHGEILSLRSAEVVARAVSGEIDLGICFSPQANAAIEIDPIAEDDLVIAVRAGHPLLKKSVRQRGALLSDLPAAAPKAFHGIEPCETHPVYSRLGIRPRFDFAYDSYPVAVEYLARSEAWALLPLRFVKSSGKRLQEVLGPSDRAKAPICIVRPRARHHSPALRRLSELLKEKQA